MLKTSILVNKFKSPDNVDELKQIYDDNGLRYYLPMEELLNVATHGIGAVLSVVGAVLMLLKASTPQSYATAILCSFGFILLYCASTAYHACTNLKIKRVLRKIDYSSINFNVIACGTGICLLFNSIYGYIAYALAISVALITIFLCVYDFKRFKNYAFASNFIVGGLLFCAYFLVNAPVPNLFLIINLLGIVCVLIGAALFAIKKPYAHAIFHVFVLIGPILFWLANYLILT